MYIYLIGALTIKPYNFLGRPWEFINYNSVDFFDSMASNIKMEIRGRKITRVLPRQNDFINDTWITDKVRFGFDSLNAQRLCNFFKITSLNTIYDVGSSQSIQYLSLEIFFFFFLKKYSKKSASICGIYGLADSLITSEALILFKDFLTKLGSANLMPSLFNSFNFVRNLRRSSYIFKNNLQNVLSADLFIFVGLNPRLESPIINLKLRKIFLKNSTKFFSFTPLNNPNFDVKFLGNSLTAFLMFCEGRHQFSSNIFNYKSFTILLGSSIFYRNDVSIFLGLLFKMNKLLFNFSFYSLYNRLTHLLVLEYGFVPCKFTNQRVLFSQKFRSNLIFNFNASNYLPEHSEIHSVSLYKDWALKDINIFFGSFGINSLKLYDYIFPLKHIIESGGTFLSILGLKEIVPIALTSLKNVQHFDSFYSLLLAYWLRFNFSSLICNKNKNHSNILRLNQLGVFNSISSVDVEASSIIHKLRGLLIKNLVSSVSVNPFITDEYTSNSILMQRAKKSYLSSYPSTYF